MRKLLFIALAILPFLSFAQDVERELPAEWANLVKGGQFVDRLLPMPVKGGLTSDTWGCDAVVPRNLSNGIEHPDWSYWGGRFFKTEDGKYNSFICRWPESHEKGHWAYHYSEIVHVQSDNPIGPYKPVGEPMGLGHNPEIFQLKDGRWMIYIVGIGHDIKHYIADSLEGPWKLERFNFDLRGRKKLRFMVNMTFAQREDGSFVAVPRAGDVWISKNGIGTYYRVSNGSEYPPVPGKYEDPVIWKTNIQYHMIVNDWYGRIAHHLRSKDGVHWKPDPGTAYYPGVSKYEDGTVTNWYKYERPHLLQDEYGRATQINFAVIDSSKHADFPNDNHNSKNISIPLTKGRLIEVLNNKKIDANTREIKLLIKAEEGFNPKKDIDFASLRLGASEEVDFGRGSKFIKRKNSGKNLILTFEGKGNGLTDDNFVAKLLGQTKEGKLLFGYARLPEVKYIEPILSSRKPYLANDGMLTVEVQNFGMVASEEEEIVVKFNSKGKDYTFKSKMPALKPYETAMVSFKNSYALQKSNKGQMLVCVKGLEQKPLYEQEQTVDLAKATNEVFIGEGHPLQQKELLLPKKVVHREAKGGIGLNYHAYIPSAFKTKKTLPIVIAFSPGGKGEQIMEKMRPAAEKAGWIVVGCDSLRNNMKIQAQEEKMEDILVNDILKTIPHDNNRIYLAGFSGGAMRAYSITARRDEKFAGVIAYGGWLGGKDYQDKPYCKGMSVAIINGVKDKGANNWKDIDAATLKKRDCTVKEFSHGGGHKVAPAETTLQVLEWLDAEYKK